MDSKKMFFSVDANKMSIKSILKKEFLELSMRAVSSANPNANNTWFTPESLEEAIPSFYNKPILGYFENGDFVSHNGTWNSDKELGLQYWDTLGSKGERILGLIRSEDTVEIVQDEAGVSWINLTCALWTQYSYKQVKRLLKDAKRSQKFGGPTKAVSVEVDVLDYDMLPNGVMKINKFNLVGITILGSQNGKEVLPGIEGAELSVMEVLGTDAYAKQETELHLAYAKLDNSEIKEEDSVKKKEMELSEETKVESEIVDENATDKLEMKEECPCEEEPILEEKKDEEPSKEFSEEDHKEEHDPEPEEHKEDPEEDKSDDEDDDHDDDKDDDDDDHDDEEDEDSKEEKDEDDHEEEHEEEKIEESQPEQCEEHGCEHDIELLKSECDVYKVKCAELEEQLNCKCSEYEAKIAEYQKICEEQEKLLSKYQHEEFLHEAYNLIYKSVLTDEEKTSYYTSCKEGKYQDVDTLKKDVAFAVYSLTSKDKIIDNTSTKMPVIEPKVFSSHDDEAETSSKKKSFWDRLNDNVRSK